MRAMLAVFAMISIAVPALGAEPPFVPPGVTPPDYVSTVVEKDAYGGKSRNWTIMHQGEWSRASPDSERSGYTEYFARNGIVRIRVSADYIGFSRPFRYDGTIDYEPRNTGVRQVYLDEACTIWEIERPKPGETGSPTAAQLNGLAKTKLSCITDDGIELWQKHIYYRDSTSSQEATHVERRSVSSEDSAPPPKLVPDWWDKHAPAPGTFDIPDHVVVMKLPERDSRAATSVRVHHRSGRWDRIDETLGAWHYVTITHKPSQFRFSFSTDETGRPAGLQIFRPAEPIDPSALDKPATLLQPKALDRNETVLNESCRWFDLTPGMQDGGATACLTQDRVALKEGFYSRTDRREWTAVSIDRRAVTFEEVKPPVELFDPQTWLAR